MNKLSLISGSVTEIQINNQPCRGINLTNTTYARLWIGHVWQLFTTISSGRSGSHLSLLHVFHVIPHTELSMGGPYTILMLISRGMVGYCLTTTIIKLRQFTRPHKSGMRSVHNQMLIQGSTLEPRISSYHSSSIQSNDTPLFISCPLGLKFKHHFIL
jgi:hypothetical protein